VLLLLAFAALLAFALLFPMDAASCFVRMGRSCHHRTWSGNQLLEVPYQIVSASRLFFSSNLGDDEADLGRYQKHECLVLLLHVTLKQYLSPSAHPSEVIALCVAVTRRPLQRDCPATLSDQHTFSLQVGPMRSLLSVCASSKSRPKSYHTNAL
jgi:hypothetical protein